MKTLMITMITVLLVSLLAVGAFAQSAATNGVLDGDPVGPPNIPVGAEIEIEFVDENGDGFNDEQDVTDDGAQVRSRSRK